MDIDIRKRGTGKTEDLIRRSAITRVPIVAETPRHSSILIDKARRIGLDIPKPFPIQVLLGSTEDAYRGFRIPEEVLIDDLDVVLNHLLGVKVAAANLSSGER